MSELSFAKTDVNIDSMRRKHSRDIWIQNLKEIGNKIALRCSIKNLWVSLILKFQQLTNAM